MMSIPTLAQRYFERVPAKWDALYSHENRWRYYLNRTLRKGLFERYAFVFEAFGDLHGQSVLDIGCGTGRFSIECAKRGARRVVGVDFAPSMIRFSRRVAEEMGVDDRCEFVEDEVVRHAFDERFDLVLAMGLFDYVADPAPLFRKVGDLAPRKFVASFPRFTILWGLQRHIRYDLVRRCPIYDYARPQVEKLFRDAGFDRLRVHEVHTGFAVSGERSRGRRREAARMADVTDRQEELDPQSIRDGRQRPVLMHVMTAPESVGFLRGQASFMVGRGYDVHVVASPGRELAELAERERVTCHAVDMTRRVSPAEDFRSLVALLRVVRRVRPDVVHAHFAKSGLLGMIAATLAGTPVRVYHIRGLRHLTATGALRSVLRASEKLSCRLAHEVLCVSRSNRGVVIEEGICAASKVKVIAGGSGNGVDATGRFVPADPARRAAARAALAIPPDAFVVGFVGRLVRDKGIVELADAWSALRDRHSRLHLVLVGPVERERGDDTVPDEVLRAFEADPRVNLTGVVRETPPVYAAMDVVVLPTYREGLPNVALEAAAMTLPIVATTIPGCIDAIEDGVTGTLVPPRDARALAAALDRYVSDAGLRELHGAAARRRVLAEFRREVIWAAVESEYRALLASRDARALAEGPAEARR